jgi:sarcosine oxidase
MRSFSSIRQQFSCPENISMSKFSIEFLKSAHQHLEVEGEDKVDVSFVEGGYLFLASEEGEAVMRENYSLQR